MPPMEERVKQAEHYPGGPMQPVEVELARGLQFSHLMAQGIEQQGKETVGLIEALSKILTDKRILSDAEWTETRAQAMRLPPGSHR